MDLLKKKAAKENLGRVSKTREIIISFWRDN